MSAVWRQSGFTCPNPRLRFFSVRTAGWGQPATGKIRGRERCPACVAVATSAWRRPDRAVWADPTHRELSIHCSSGTERGGLRFVEEINRFEKLPVDLGPESRSADQQSSKWNGRLPRLYSGPLSPSKGRPFISRTVRLACHIRINQTGETPVPPFSRNRISKHAAQSFPRPGAM